jgi:hypothetical protein
MKQFKVKRKHLAGQVKDFPRRVLQAMVDEQVRQGNQADPRVFAIERTAGKSQGGFDWHESILGRDAWVGTITWKKFYLIPKREKPRCPDRAPCTEAKPHEIIQHMLDKGMAVWVCVSDESYDTARANIGRHANRVTRYSPDSYYPVQTCYAGWKYAIPIDTATMTEITEVPK